MNVRPRLTVFDAAKYHGLGIEYANDLPASIHGCLEPGDEPRFILINANQPDFEKRFTIAHEIAHYLFHSNQPQRKYHHWFLSRQWYSRFLAKASRRTRLAMPLIFNKEREADIWAMCLLIQIADTATLKPYLKRHPEKSVWHLAALALSLCKALARLFKSFW